MGMSDRLFGSARDRFAAQVRDQLRGVDGIVQAQYERDQFRITYRTAAGRTGIVNLDNVFHECQGVPADERRRRIADLLSIATAPEVPDDFAQVRPLLRPVLRHVTWGQGTADGAQALVSRAAMPFLAEMIVIDMPASMAYVSRDQLSVWGVSADDAFEAARGNMAAEAMKTLGADRRDGPALVRFTDDGERYCASLPLVDGWMAGMGVRFGGQPVVFISRQDGLLFATLTDSPNSPDNGLPQLLKLAEEEFTAAVRPVSPVPYTIDDTGAVVELHVAPEHPAAQALRRAQVLLAATVYAEQTSFLRAEYERENIDVFVAALMAVTGVDGTALTFTTWTDGIESLLPRAHYISMVDSQGAVRVPWDVVAADFDLIPVEGFDPPRFRVGPWSADEIASGIRTRAGRS